MTVLLKTLNENLSEKSNAVQPAANPGPDQSLDSETSKDTQGPGSAGTSSSKHSQLKKFSSVVKDVEKPVKWDTCMKLYPLMTVQATWW